MVRSLPKPRRLCKMFGVTRFPPPTPDQPKPRPMSQFKPLPPIQELQQALDYDPATGMFTSKQSRGSLKIGDSVGTRSYKKDNKPNRICFMLDRRMFSAHRVAWYLMTGNDPLHRKVDHEDRNPFNNAFSNLRLATSKQNSGNRLAKGWHRTPHGCYHVQISIDGKSVYLGSFTTVEEAHEVYIAKHVEIYGEFSPYCATVKESNKCHHLP